MFRDIVQREIHQRRTGFRHEALWQGATIQDAIVRLPGLCRRFRG